MSQNILIPLDGSALGEAAVDYVNGMITRLAPGEKISITLLHVLTNLEHSLYLHGGAESVTIPYTGKELDIMKAKAVKYLEEKGERFQGKGVTVSCVVTLGDSAAREILKAEEEHKIDLVAMSTHGRGGFARFAFGSVADKVLRTGTVPVLLVRATEE
jgi:nucleotide-binding universal stress UspA family protein